MDMSVGRSHLIRYEEVVPPGYFLHDVSLDQVVLQHGHAIVDQDGRLGRLQHTGHVSRVTIQAVKHVGSLGPCCGWVALTHCILGGHKAY